MNYFRMFLFILAFVTLFSLICSSVSVTNNWKDATTISGKISNFQKSFSYSSELSKIYVKNLPVNTDVIESSETKDVLDPLKTKQIFFVHLSTGENKIPLQGAVVTIDMGDSGEKQCTTDLSGYCNLDGLKPDTLYNVTISHPSYGSTTNRYDIRYYYYPPYGDKNWDFEFSY